ncbi:MAG: hypothetical protein F2534_18905 [Actinobacteria bacterium]|jgi:hypothetical protein|nr:hypothetical protein [Actinomycetota bacterium]
MRRSPSTPDQPHRAPASGAPRSGAAGWEPSRRRFLAVGGTALLGGLVGGLATACGGGGDGGDADTATTVDTSGFVVVQRFPAGQSLAPGDVRLPVSLRTTAGALLTDGPERLTGVLRDERGDTVATIDTPRRGTGLGVPYWSITATVPEPGLYDLQIDGAAGDPTPFFLYDPSEIAVPGAGALLPPFDTPTTADARGVDPVCTRLDAPCPFHDVTLTEALATGRPVVYLIGTPAHCSTAVCGPGLEFMISVAQQYADRATFVHAEVFSNPEGTDVAPAVTAYGLGYEPVIWIADDSGTIVRRIDVVWDETELAELLADSLS